MAYSIAWNESNPVGSSTNASTIDTELQDLKKSVRERMNNICENTWETDANDPKTLAVSAIAGTPSVAVVTSTGDQTIATGGAQVVLTWEAETLDTGSYHDNSTNNERLTVTTAAYYRISADIRLVEAASNVGNINVELRKNGVSIRVITTPVIASDAINVAINEIVLAAANDYYDVAVSHSIGGNVTFTSGVTVSTFSIERINGTT